MYIYIYLYIHLYKNIKYIYIYVYIWTYKYIKIDHHIIAMQDFSILYTKFAREGYSNPRSIDYGAHTLTTGLLDRALKCA